jgi:hypothetical protein
VVLNGGRTTAFRAGASAVSRSSLRIADADLPLQDPSEPGRVLLVSGVSVALYETAREVSERQVLPAGGLRERFEQ